MMLALLHLFGVLAVNQFKSRRRLEIENLYLRHQLNIAMRRTAHRLRLRGADRALLVWMTWLWPSLLGLSRVVSDIVDWTGSLGTPNEKDWRVGRCAAVGLPGRARDFQRQ